MKRRWLIFSTRWPALIWLFIILTFSIWLIVKSVSGPLFNTDLIALLPQFKRDPVLEQSIDRIQGKFGEKLILVLDVPASANTSQITGELREVLAELENSDRLEVISHENALSELIDFYRRLKFSFLSDEMYNFLQTGENESFERKIISSYLQPTTFITSRMVRDDPLLLLSFLLEEKFNQQTGSLYLENDLLVHRGEGRYHIFAFAKTTTSPFALATKNNVMSSIERASERILETRPEANFHIVGPLAHIHAGTQNARGEVSFFGTVSIIGVTALFIGFFRSVRPLFITLITIGVSCIAGLAACLAVFDEVSLLTLVFGVSLVGISVDYSFHYFCKGFDIYHAWSPHKALSHVFPGITLGLITSVIGFSSLTFAPFPGIRQMAIFSIVGLISAYLCVVFWYPILTKNLKFPPVRLPLKTAGAFIQFWKNTSLLIKSGMIFGLLAISVGGVMRLTIQDDIRFLQKPDARILETENWIGKILQEKPASQFFLVEGRDNEELLVREERLASSLDVLKAENRLGGHIALSSFIPSAARQKETRELIRPIIENKNGGLEKIADQIGLTPQILRSYRAEFASSENNIVSLNDWLRHPASAQYRDLWLGQTERGVMGLVQIKDVRDLDALNDLVRDHMGVHFIDGVATYTNLFEGYRRQIMLLTAVSYIFVFLLLLMRYGPVGGVVIMLAPVLAACVSVGAIGVIGESLTLFHIMALLIVLGVGVDYSIFFREATNAHITTALAAALSAFTTILSFGLLIFSKTAAIHAFGLTVMIGIMVAFLLSPLANWGRGRGGEISAKT